MKIHHITLSFMLSLASVSCSQPQTSAPVGPSPKPDAAPLTDSPQEQFPAKSPQLEGFASWAELEASDPELSSQHIFDGKDPSAELLGEDARCSIYLQTRLREDSSPDRWVLRSSFRHLEDKPRALALPVLKADDQSLQAEADDKTVSVFLKLSRAGEIFSLQKAQIKWFHINHYDVFICEELQTRR